MRTAITTTTAVSSRAVRQRLNPLASIILTAALAVIAAPAYAQSYVLNSSSTATMSSDATYTTFTVGQTADSNDLTINGGAVVTATDTVIIGQGSASTDNYMTVTDGAIFASTISGSGKFFTLGLQGAANTLIIKDGGKVSAATMFRVGFQSSDNYLLVSGVGSVLEISGAASSAHLCIAGSSGFDNYVEVAEGGTISTPAVRIGGMAGATAMTNNNSVIVSNAGSTLDVSENLYIAMNSGGSKQNITGNTLTIQDFGIVRVDGNIIINDYSIGGAKQNFLRLGKNGLLFWKGDRVADFQTLVASGYVQYFAAGWATDTNPAHYAAGYNTALDYTVIAYGSY